MGGFDVVALGELLIDFTHNDMSEQGNPMLEDCLRSALKSRG